ncbi:hypothetical protein HK102_000748, partial [Quaeritorhiza haematococci]
VSTLYSSPTSGAATPTRTRTHSCPHPGTRHRRRNRTHPHTNDTDSDETEIEENTRGGEGGVLGAGRRKTTSQKRLEHELALKELKERSEMERRKFKARPVPASSKTPRYAQLMSKMSTRSAVIRAKRIAELKASSAPFSFLSSPSPYDGVGEGPEKKKTVRERRREEEEGAKQVEATVVEALSQVRRHRYRLHKQKQKKDRQQQEVQSNIPEELLKTAASSVTAAQGKKGEGCVKQKEDVTEGGGKEKDGKQDGKEAKRETPKIVLDAAEAGRRRRKMVEVHRSPTHPTHTNPPENETVKTQPGSAGVTPDPQKDPSSESNPPPLPTSIVATSTLAQAGTALTRPTHTTKLRLALRTQQTQLQKQSDLHKRLDDEARKEKEQKAREKVRARLAESQAEKERERRRKEARRRGTSGISLEYQQRLEEMNERLERRPCLFERVAEKPKATKQELDEMFNKVIADAGLTLEDLAT